MSVRARAGREPLPPTRRSHSRRCSSTPRDSSACRAAPPAACMTSRRPARCSRRSAASASGSSCSARSTTTTARATARWPGWPPNCACRAWPPATSTRTRAPLQDALVAVRHHTTLDASEPVRRGNWSHVLASPEAMAARFAEHPEAVAETGRLAERLRFDLLDDLGYRYPGSEDPDAPRRLAELCSAQLDDRYADESAGHRADAAARLEEELRVIDALGLAGFFLLHRDLLELAREVAVEVRGTATVRALLPPGRGRGSSVSSIVCYLTGLSHIDPGANDLFLGRFLHAESGSLPALALDFPRDVRAVLIPRVHERFGPERSALVAAFPTYRARGAIRELGKALGLPPGEIERVARGSEGWDAREG